MPLAKTRCFVKRGCTMAEDVIVRRLHYDGAIGWARCMMMVRACPVCCWLPSSAGSDSGQIWARLEPDSSHARQRWPLLASGTISASFRSSCSRKLILPAALGVKHGFHSPGWQGVHEPWAIVRAIVRTNGPDSRLATPWTLSCWRKPYLVPAACVRQNTHEAGAVPRNSLTCACRTKGELLDVRKGVETH
ncbi:hypothetical protein Thiowin_04787 [Thiorhodovibrio winogradskyi]|uniref:Uncharacterized protein n=1 Tax=Thiorhodovibrio winogradskyi TaxID=77007 RepID=A0ABZ0SH59_9GAMM